MRLCARYDRSARDPGNVDTSISAEDEWWQRLKDVTAAAEVIVVIVWLDRPWRR
ncbi:MAG: hypothetical protein WAN86_06070 [Hyphomicrobiaceae bacterium]